MRKIWNLPNTAHCYLLPLLCGCLPFRDEICRRFLNFVYKCMFSAVDVVRSVAMLLPTGLPWGLIFNPHSTPYHRK